MDERIWAWKFNKTWTGGYWREDKNAVKPEDGGAEYVRADLYEAQAALIAEARAVLFKAAHFNGHAQVEEEARQLLAKLDNA